MKVQVPKAVDVSDLVRTRLARSERLAVVLLAVAAFARAQQPLLFHEAGDCRIAGDGPEAGILARESEEIVVMELEAPSRMVSMLAGDGVGEGFADAGVRARVSVDPARERGEGVLGGAGDVPPSLDRLEREVGRAARRRMAPCSRGELLDAAFELPGVGGGGEQRTHDLKAQTGPSHARTGRVIGLCHSIRVRGEGLRRYGDDPTRARENKGIAIVCASAGPRDRSYETPQKS